MNLLSKTLLGLMIIVLAIITMTMLKIQETNKQNTKLYNKLSTILSSSANNATPKINNNSVKPDDSQHENTLRGIDVSHWNGNITEDLPNKDKLHFVICKSTEGERFVDGHFKRNWKYLEEKNIIKGAYHFYLYPQNPIQQAMHFCNTVGELEASDFPLIIDIEEGSLHKKYIDHFQLKKDILKFLEFIESKTNKIPIIYSNYSFINQYLNDPTFSKYPLWLAEYSHQPEPLIPNVWKNKGCLIWQKTDRYDIHSSEVDFDVYFKQ